jgi:hypothetical protein
MHGVAKCIGRDSTVQYIQVSLLLVEKRMYNAMRMHWLVELMDCIY